MHEIGLQFKILVYKCADSIRRIYSYNTALKEYIALNKTHEMKCTRNHTKQNTRSKFVEGMYRDLWIYVCGCVYR